MPRAPQYRALAGIDRKALAAFQAGIRKRYSNEQILEELRRASETQFCPRCVAALERILPLEGIDDDPARPRIAAAS